MAVDRTEGLERLNEYGKIKSAFWRKGTGKRLRGDLESQVLASYLMTCPSRHMTGIFYVPLPTICHETGLPIEGVQKALRRLSDEDFAHYDDVDELVFLPNMAREQIGDALKVGDKRHRGITNHLEPYLSHRFTTKFLEIYAADFDLASFALESESQSASKPLRCHTHAQAHAQEHAQAHAQSAEASPAPTKRTVSTSDSERLAECVGGAGGMGMAPKQFERLKLLAPDFDSRAIELNVDPFEMLTAAWKRFNSDPDVIAKKLATHATFLGQWRQWTEPIGVKRRGLVEPGSRSEFAAEEAEQAAANARGAA